MKDKLLYTTIGLLVGLVIAQWTMPSGQASGIHPGTGIIAMCEETNHYLDENGVVWWIYPLWGWKLAGSEYNPPVPVSQIKFWSSLYVITTDNVAWYKNGSNWVNFGPWPGGPVQTAPQTFGGIKSKYSGKD